jgi:hypothetical protein
MTGDIEMVIGMNWLGDKRLADRRVRSGDIIDMEYLVVCKVRLDLRTYCIGGTGGFDGDLVSKWDKIDVVAVHDSVGIVDDGIFGEIFPGLVDFVCSFSADHVVETWKRILIVSFAAEVLVRITKVCCILKQM